MQEAQETRVLSLSKEDPWEKGIATHSGTLAWKIPWIEDPDGLQRAWHVSKSWSRLKQLSTHTWVAQVRLCPLKFIYSLNKYSLFLTMWLALFCILHTYVHTHIYLYTHTHTPGEACILIFSKLVNFYLYDYNLF